MFLTGDVDGATLQAAADKALERLPYFRWALVRRKGLYYYATNDLPFVIAESERPRRIGGATTNYHNVDITYHANKIDFSMNHGFCDGLGLNRLIETTLYHYFCMKDGVTYDDTGIYTDKVPYDEAETFDAFRTQVDIDRDEARKLASKDGSYRLPELEGRKIQGPTMYRMPVRVSEADLMAWCKANSSSPAAAISVMFAKAIARANDLREGKIRSVAPASLRKYQHAEKTFTNCSAAVFFPLEASDLHSRATGELAAKMRERMRIQTGGDNAKLLGGSINMMTHLGRRIPTFWLKNRVMTLAESKQDTFFMDYVGSLRTNGYSDQISEVRYLSADTSGGSLFVVLSATAGSFFMNVLQTFETRRYYQAFCDILNEQGIPCEQLECDSYLNPEVKFGKEQR